MSANICKLVTVKELFNRVGFLPWQKLFLPGQWKKTVKTVAKTSKNRQKLAKSKTP